MTWTVADQNARGAEAVEGIGRCGDERGMGVDAGRWGVLNQVGLEEDALTSDSRSEKPDSIPYNLRGALVRVTTENRDSRHWTPPVRDSAQGGLMNDESAGYCERGAAEE
jgi:hypothetical protein